MVARKQLILYAGLRLYKFGKRYYYLNNWYDFISELADHYKLILIAPIKIVQEIDEKEYFSQFNPKAEVFEIADFGETWFGFYRNLTFFQFLKGKLVKTIQKSDLIFLRVPSPGHIFIQVLSMLLRKKMGIFVCGSTYSQNRYVKDGNQFLNCLFKLHKILHASFYQFSKINFVYNKFLAEEIKIANFYYWSTPLNLSVDKGKTKLRQPVQFVRICKSEASKQVLELISWYNNYSTKIDYKSTLNLILASKDQNYMVKIRNAVNRSPKSSNVTIETDLPNKELLAKLRKFHIHLVNSSAEGFPRVITETAACGIPTLLLNNELHNDPRLGAVCHAEEDFNCYLKLTNNYQEYSQMALQFALNNTLEKCISRFKKIINL